MAATSLTNFSENRFLVPTTLPAAFPDCPGSHRPFELRSTCICVHLHVLSLPAILLPSSFQLPANWLQTSCLLTSRPREMERWKVGRTFHFPSSIFSSRPRPTFPSYRGCSR